MRQFRRVYLRPRRRAHRPSEPSCVGWI